MISVKYHPKLLAVVIYFLVSISFCPAKEWHVSKGSAAGTGTKDSPFGTIQEGVKSAQPGDIVLILPGTYSESMETARAGTQTAPITIRAAEGFGTVTLSKSTCLLHVSHAYHIVDGFVFDGQYANDDLVKINSGAHHTLVKNCEMRNIAKDGIDIDSADHVTIDNCFIHHCLNAKDGRTDAHAIVAGLVRDLTIRNTRCHTFSGDAFQVDPSRTAPGWDRILLENCIFWLEPLPKPENGFAAGAVPGENAVDTKVFDKCAFRPKLTIRNVVASGYRAGLISDMAAFNLKENIDADLENITVSDSEIAFRVRGPSKERPGGANVLVQNAIVYDVNKGVRYEDEPPSCILINCTFGTKVLATLESAFTEKLKPILQNCLFLDKPIAPISLEGNGNMIVDTGAVVDAEHSDYHLSDMSKALNTGTMVPKLKSDRDGVPRPQGSRFDVGAYEWNGESFKPALLEFLLPPQQIKVELDSVNPSGSAKLTWLDRTVNEDFFDLEHSEDDKTFTSTRLKENETSATVTGLKGGTLYYFRMRSGNRLGVSAWSESVRIQTGTAANPPPAPQAIDGKQELNKVSLQWKDVGNSEDGYQLERSTDGKTFAALAKADSNQVQYSDTTITKNTAYWYRVRAFNKAGVSDWATSSEIKVGSTGAPPAAPTNLTAQRRSNSATFSWKDNSNNEEGFILERSFRGEDYQKVTTKQANTTSADSGGIPPNTYYRYQVRAFNKDGISEPSNNVTVGFDKPSR